MRLWLSRTSEVPIREQLVTQIVLGILSDDLKAGARLPSTRELARRFQVHPNTVSAAYKDLEKDGWLELRRGSGVYVGTRSPAAELSHDLTLDHMIAGLFRSARERGIPLSVVQSRLRRSLTLQPPDHFLLIEPCSELSEIVVFEIRRAVTLPVKACNLDSCISAEQLHGAVPVVLPSKAELVRRKLPGTEILRLRLRSVTESLSHWLPVRSDALVAVASAWPDFLERGRTMLVAAGFDVDALLFRNAGRPGWEKGLEQTAAVICDSHTATRVPKGCRTIPFAILAESSLADLRRHEQFISESIP
jgi:GntR family transcriptional regulator